MDEAFNQHASHVRRKNRSTTNLNRLTLAPLTSKLPLDRALDVEFALQDSLTTTPLVQPSTSYIQGRSAPTTPTLLSRAPSRSRSRARLLSRSNHNKVNKPLAKSKSAVDLNTTGGPTVRPMIRQTKSGYTTPSHRLKNEHGSAPALEAGDDRSDSDWLLRIGASISSETRESKGQAWLVSRESSTSLTTVMRDPEEEVFEMELARQKSIASRMTTRRGSLERHGEDGSPTGSRWESRRGSRQGSRSHSRAAGAKASFVFTPAEPVMDDYFEQDSGSRGGVGGLTTPGSDFVSLDINAETAAAAVHHDTFQEDEAAIRRLVKQRNSGLAGWMDSMLGWSLLAVSDNDEGTDGDEHYEDDDEAAADENSALKESQQLARRSIRHFEGVSSLPEERMPAPRADEGGWNDAAWLLSVASRVLL